MCPCRSLLGTWSGAPEEMWQPHKSTILQVLLSITSMILVRSNLSLLRERSIARN